MILLSLCIYAATDYSVNPRQKEFKYPYPFLKYLFFTNISLYYTIVASVTGIIYRSTGLFRSAFHQMMWTSPIFNSITTSTFWILYFYKKEYIVDKNHLIPGYETYLLTELSLHLFPLILSYLEQVDIKLRKSRIHYSVFAVIIMAYCGVVHIDYCIRGLFLYTFLNKMNIALRAAFFIGMFGCCALFYNILMLVNRRCNKCKSINQY